MSRLSLFLLIALVFSGCFKDQALSTPKQILPPAAITKSTPKNIKGIIKNLSFDDSGYCYDIVSTDTSNGKLGSGKFCGNRHYFDTGDLIYATILDGKISSMYLIQRSNSAKPRQKFSDQRRSSSKIQAIKPPTNEKINFD